MSTARALIWPGSFGDTTLPRVNLDYAPPLPNAVHSWSADTLPEGGIAQWTCSVDGTILNADDGQPQALTSQGLRAVRFDGEDDRMRAAFSLPTPHTVAAVFRFHQTPAQYFTAFADYGGSGVGAVSYTGTTWRAGAETGTVSLTPPVAANTGWHVALLTNDGPRSVLHIDHHTAEGTLGTGTRTGVTLGFAGSIGRTPVDYARVEVIPGPMTTLEGQTIVNTLRARYGI